MAIQELSAVANDTYVGGSFFIIWREAGDASHQCGYIIMDDGTAPEEVLVNSTSGIPFAVTALQADLDIDTEVTSGVMYEYYLLHTGTVLRLPADTNAQAPIQGGPTYRSETVAGMTNFALGTPLYTELVGWHLEHVAVAADLYNKVIT